jgi:riboflavin kinase / FMN adenylyltransferase
LKFEVGISLPVWVTSSLTTALVPTTVALGNFDGVHRGHQQVIRQAIVGERGSKLSAIAPKLDGSEYDRPEYDRSEYDGSEYDGLEYPGSEIALGSRPRSTYTPVETPKSVYPTVLTFNPHPQEFFSGQRRPLLTTPEEKAARLASLGIAQLVLLPFDRDLARLSPLEFVEQILVRQLQAKQIAVGENFHFGKNRAGNAQTLKEIAATYGITTTIVPLYRLADERVSSSSIRHALEQGDIEQANRLLGQDYSLTGMVVRGQQLGRTLGFPTANLQVLPDKFLPRWGVYGVRVDSPHATGLLGVLNIGCRPTIGGEQPSVEVHLLDWSGDLYGQTLTLHLEAFLRPEQKFESLDALKAQIQRDCDIVRSR